MNVPQTGDRLAQYEVLEAIGAGGMGRVFRARDTRLGRQVAIKVLAPEHAGEPAMRERFEREARSIAALAHPGIVAIHELGAIGEQPFIVMELLEGVNLRERLEGGALSCRLTLDMAAQMIDALAAAHDAGIVHRDLKPENVFLTRSGAVKLLDFGLARRSIETCDTGELALTGPHVLVGTLRYMSPEQACGAAPTPASDMFAAGILLYELVTGVHPFESATAAGLLHGLIHAEPIAASRHNPSIPAVLDALILEMLARDGAHRPAASEVAVRLRAMTCEPDTRAIHPALTGPRLHTVGRSNERDVLRAAWLAARAGQTRLISISGEPGIGKTTLVDDFLAEIVESGSSCLIGRGRCSETLAAAEAYLPALEVLESLIRAGGESIQRAMRQLAPTWYAQVAPLSPVEASSEETRQQMRSASQQRIMRELRAFLQEVSRFSPVVIFLDDVHWADAPTVDLLAYVTRGLDGARLLLVTTHRVSELLLVGHPLAPLLLDLQARGVARALPLPFLARADVERYLELEFPGHAFPGAFITLVHTRTEGSPLFMVDMLADLRDRGVIRRAPEWRLADQVPAIERQLPASIRSMIQRRLDQLKDDDLRLLRIASVQGSHFDACVLAEAAGLSAVEVEERLETLDRVHGLVRLAEERELPDGVVTARYHFVHVLYQKALHASLTPARRASFCAAVARSLRAHHAAQIGPVASRIAFLFESSREFRAAADAYAAAAEHAGQLVAHREAATLARRGLGALQHLPETPDRAELELVLRITLGVALLITEGYTSIEGQRSYVRARQLCEALGRRAELFPVLWGLWVSAICTADYDAAEARAHELVTMAREGRPEDRVRAAWAHGTTALHLGDPATALGAFEWGLESYREDDDRVDRHLYGHDAGITCRSFGAFARWFLGDADRAAADVERTCADAASLSHPQSQAFALLIAANVHRCRGDVERTLARAAEAQAISEREGLPQFREWSRAQVGWAMAQQGASDEGLAMTTEALQALAQLGSAVGRPFFTAARAEILVAHRPSEALEAIEDALADAEASRERMFSAELWRLKGCALATHDPAAGRRCFLEAFELATRQGALALAARAAHHLDRERGSISGQIARTV